MNPHFISNALVSAQNLVLENKPEEASDFISDFSALMRFSIKATSKEFIPLSDEIEMVKKYLTLQQKRLTQKFDFQINIDNNLESDFINYPPLLLQPFVENSIKHAFKNIDYVGKIDIKITTENGFIKILIIDNGVGFKNSNKDHKNSYSLKITEKRLKNIELKYKKKCFFNIFENNPKGTIVEIVVPDSF